jgi:hypothetical protein
MSTCQQKKSLRTRYFGKRKCIFQKVLEDGTNSCLLESITDYIRIVFMYWNICTIHFMDSGFNLDNDKSTCVIRSFFLVALIHLFNNLVQYHSQGPSWSWSFDRWIYNCLYNKCPSPLKLRVRTLFIARCTRYNLMWKFWSVTCDRFLPTIKLTTTI